MYYIERSGNTVVRLVESDVPQIGMEQITKAEYDAIIEDLDISGHGTIAFRMRNEKLEEFRYFRMQQFSAFDIYKSNIDYGIIEETEEEREKIISWYMLMLEFPGYITEENYDTIEFPETPDVIKSYLSGGSSESVQQVKLTKMATQLKSTTLLR